MKTATAAKAKAVVKAERKATVPIPAGKIKILVKENPRISGTLAHRMFALYREGMTVEAFCSAGGRKSDIRWDVARGHVEIITAAEPASRKRKGGKR